MPKKNIKYKIRRMANKIFIPVNDIKFFCRNSCTDNHIYGIRSPLTYTWIEFEVSEKAILANIIPIVAQEISYYYYDIQNTLLFARRFQKELDLIPLDQDEGNKFGGRKWPYFR